MADQQPRRVELAERIRTLLGERPRSLYEVLQQLEHEDYRTVLQAWGDLRARVALVPDQSGHYSLPESTHWTVDEGQPS